MINKILYENRYTSGTFFYNGGKNTTKESSPVESYFKLQLVFDFKEGLRFVASAPNVSFCEKNIFKAIFRLLEHESIGMAKYNGLKYRINNLDLRKRL